MKNGFLSLLVLALLSACGREEAQTYQTPKQEQPAAPVAQVAPQPVGSGFTAKLPEGWSEVPGSGMRKVSYSIDGTSIDFYLISLMMGDVPSNVNRWRGQVGLPPASPEAITQEVESFQIGEHGVKYIEIYNEDGGRGIISAIVDLAPKFWYFTAKGSVVELKANASDIRKFIESVKVDK